MKISVKNRQNFNKIFLFLNKVVGSILLKFLKRGFFDKYQPIYGQDIKEAIRVSSDRYNNFSRYINNSKVSNVLDIGCNIGYFSLRCSESKKFVVGVDYDFFNITICNYLKNSHNLKNSFFQRALIDVDYIDTMPSFDSVIFLSVFHHWVKEYGKDQSLIMLEKLCNKTKVCLIFETGQSNEIGTKWFDKMSFIGNDINIWAEETFKKFGFSQIIELGTYDTGLTKTKRTMFAVLK